MALINARSVCNKPFIIRDFFKSHQLDFLFLTETWLKDKDNVTVNKICPPACRLISAPRSSRGGGLAAVVSKQFTCRSVDIDNFNTFESLLLRVGSVNPLFVLLCYRPPGSKSEFLTEFSELLSSIVMKVDNLVLTGDFNFHIDNPLDTLANEFISITQSLNLSQHVSGPTHNLGHTLDLVFTLGLDINNLCIGEFFVSDHKYILFNIDFIAEPIPNNHSFRSRTLNSSSAEMFKSAFSDLSKHVILPTDTNDLVVLFNNLCESALDTVAPLKLKKKRAIVANSSPWMNEDIRMFKRECRKAEREWKKTKDIARFTHMKELLVIFNQKVEDARSSYFSNLINLNQNKPKTLFAVINTLVNPPPLQFLFSQMKTVNSFYPSLSTKLRIFDLR